MTKVICPERDCKYNENEVCTKETIELEHMFRGERPNCNNLEDR